MLQDGPLPPGEGPSCKMDGIETGRVVKNKTNQNRALFGIHCTLTQMEERHLTIAKGSQSITHVTYSNNWVACIVEYEDAWLVGAVFLDGCAKLGVDGCFDLRHFESY